MIIFLLLLIALIFNGASFASENRFNESYLEKQNTTAINGIFVILIIFSHYTQYAQLGGPYDDGYLVFREHLNQMVVASFLFYSGYGMMESVKKKGMQYVDNIPKKGLLLLLKFDVAVLLFLAVDCVIGSSYDIKTILLAFTTWTSVGNSNWYITAILMVYMAMYIGFKITGADTRGKQLLSIIIMTVLIVIAVYWQMKIDRPMYCYDTMILAIVGFFYSMFRQNIEQYVCKNDIAYYITVMIAVGVYIVSYLHRWDYGIEGYSVWAIAFITIIVLLTMKINIYNNCLYFFGKHVFSIYILQRIPMLFLNSAGCIERHPYISLMVVFATVIPLALLFEKIQNKLMKI